MTVTTSISTFVTRAGGSPKRSPRSPSPTHTMIDTLKVNELLGANRLGSLMVMTQSQGICTNIGQYDGISYVQIRHNGGWAGGDACRGAGMLRLGLYDYGSYVDLATWGITRSDVSKSADWRQRVETVCRDQWTIRKNGTGAGSGGFRSRSIRVDNMTVTEMCDLIKKFM